MAEVQWIKIYIDMFDKRKIKKIRRLPAGNDLLLIWIMLLAMAGKCNAGGMIYITESVPFTEEDLADELDFDVNTIRLALGSFRELDMIATSEDGFINILGWEEYQNTDRLSEIREQTRKRVAEHRSRKKQELTAGSECAYCGRYADTVDHIIPRSKGGADISENIVPCCKNCNSSKKDKDLVDFLNDSFYLTYQKIDHKRVQKNDKLMRFVAYDPITLRYSNVTVTLGNAIEEDKEEDQEKEFHSFTHSDVSEDEKALDEYIKDRVEESGLEGRDAEEYREQVKKNMQIKLIGGTLGQNILRMSDEQFDDLCTKLSFDELHRYIGIVVECEKNGKPYTKKTHYQAILDMVNKDRRIKK